MESPLLRWWTLCLPVLCLPSSTRLKCGSEPQGVFYGRQKVKTQGLQKVLKQRVNSHVLCEALQLGSSYFVLVRTLRLKKSERNRDLVWRLSSAESIRQNLKGSQFQFNKLSCSLIPLDAAPFLQQHTNVTKQQIHIKLGESSPENVLHQEGYQSQKEHELTQTWRSNQKNHTTTVQA